MSKKASNDKYRDYYIEQKIKATGISEDSEIEIGLNYVKDRLNDDDSNINEVMKEYEIAMRVEKRPRYVDPSLGNGRRSYIVSTNGKGTGKELYQRAKKGGRN